MSNHDITDVYDILTVGTETIPPKEINVQSRYNRRV